MATSDPVADHYREQATLSRLVANRLVALWPRDNLARWDSIWPKLVAVIAAGQILAAAQADAYTSAALGEDDQEPDYLVDALLIGAVASDGRSLAGLLKSPLIHSQTALLAGLTGRDALRVGARSLVTIGVTQVADAGRVADGVAVVSHGAAGYTRYLVRPSCSRCAVLAGRFYKWNTGFRRHPKCDCRHAPVARRTEPDFSPRQYFGSLSRAQQDHTFGRAAAQAIRDGADISRVVNASRGVATASGSQTTAAGVSVRGWYAQVQRTLQGLDRNDRLPVRLMPEAIYARGLDRPGTLRLLAQHGFLGPGDPVVRAELERMARAVLIP
jgi:hypothetical protein